MNWKLKWESAELDDIDSVYDAAEKDENIAALLKELETQALEEAKANCDAFTVKGKRMTEKDFDKLTSADKEIMISRLAGNGISTIDRDLNKKTLKAECKPDIAAVQACAMFLLLDRLEKLESVITVLAPKWTLELKVPAGKKHGMAKWEMLIMMLHPWLSVREVA